MDAHISDKKESGCISIEFTSKVSPSSPNVEGGVSDNILHGLSQVKNDVKYLATKKANKIEVISVEASAEITLEADKRYLVKADKDIVFNISPTDDTYAHSYEIDLVVGDTAYSVAFPADVVWVKDLEIEANSRYIIVVDYDGSTYTAMYAKIGG